MNNFSASVPIENSISWKFKAKILFVLLLIFGIVVFAAMQMNNPYNFRNQTEQNNESSGNGGKATKNNVDIKIDAEKKMHQVGDHFNKHGREMGYTSKKEYGDAALKFAQENSKNPKAEIFEGKWNTRGTRINDKQIGITFENRTVIIDKRTGQLLDFYQGSEMRGLIELIKIQ